MKLCFFNTLKLILLLVDSLSNSVRRANVTSRRVNEGVHSVLMPVECCQNGD